MAIYGFGSVWDHEYKNEFFSNEKIIIGWDRIHAADLYSSVASLKTGDVIYLKSNKPGSRTIRVKGIGIITKNLINCIASGEYENTDINSWNSLFVRVKWIDCSEFSIIIPDDSGKLTNIRASTMYEEHLPEVQDAILSHLLSHLNTPQNNSEGTPTTA